MLQQNQAIDWPNSGQSSTPARRGNRYPGLERLVCAAVCNTQLAESLLTTPALALRRYEVGRSLSSVERRLVLSVGAASDIAEFAGRLQAVLMQHLDSVAYDDRELERTTTEPVRRETRPTFAVARP